MSTYTLTPADSQAYRHGAGAQATIEAEVLEQVRRRSPHDLVFVVLSNQDVAFMVHDGEIID